MSRRPPMRADDLYLTTLLPARLAQPLTAITVECPHPREHQQSASMFAACHPSRMLTNALAASHEGLVVVIHADAIDARVGPGPVDLDPIGRARLERLLTAWGSTRPSFARPSTIELSNIPPDQLRLVHAEVMSILRAHLVRPRGGAQAPLTVGLLG